MLQNFPSIIINNIKANIGTYTKKILLTKGFMNLDKKSLFLPERERTLSDSFCQNGKKKRNGYLLEILFHGLNYSAKRVKLYRKPFQIDVHKSEIFVNKEAIDTVAKSRIYKRRLLFFSYNIQYLKNIEIYIKKLKSPNSYTGKGLFSREDKYKIKKILKKKNK